MWPTPDQVNNYYGNPDINGDGQPDPKWEAQNLTYIVPPYKMRFSWGPEVKRLRVHKKVAGSLMRILKKISQEMSAHDISYYQLDVTGGVYNFRPVRGTNSKLSMHSYGAAIDLAPELNPMGEKYDRRPHLRMIPEKVLKMFADEGWALGIHFTRPDNMHAEAVTRPLKKG